MRREIVSAAISSSICHRKAARALDRDRLPETGISSRRRLLRAVGTIDAETNARNAAKRQACGASFMLRSVALHPMLVLMLPQISLIGAGEDRRVVGSLRSQQVRQDVPTAEMK
jgi:hypothetical protein